MTWRACAAAGVAAALMLGPGPAVAQEPPARPRILGVAHAAYFVSDLRQARRFYEEFLGFGEAFSLPRPDGSERIVFVKINDEQYVELFAEPGRGDGQMSHMAFSVDDAVRMRDYLAARGVKVPEKVGKGRSGNLNFTITDPDGHGVEFVQYLPDALTARHHGQDMPATHVARRMTHVGFTVASVGAALHFYGDILGFHEFWRGSADDTTLSWINMRVPDGDDYVEFMLYREPPGPERLGSQNHICLEIPDVPATIAALKLHAAATGYTRPLEAHVGRNRKRIANIYDPDGTRVELMEPATLDGRPTPSSAAPPPRP